MEGRSTSSRLAFNTVVLIAIVVPVTGFFPTWYHALVSPSSKTHPDITKLAHRRTAIAFMKSFPLIYPKSEWDNAMSTREFRAAYKTFKDFSGEPDLNKKTKNLPAAHSDNEQIYGSNSLMLRRRRDAISAIRANYFVYARRLTGQLFHALQDFYSHSNWIEMGKTTRNFGLADPKNTGLIGSVAPPSMATCSNCRLGVEWVFWFLPVPVFRCRGNIRRAVNGYLTSGYAHMIGASGSSSKPRGKCSHGGDLDLTTYRNPRGGINKDSLNAIFSPHEHLHRKAANVAISATSSFFSQMRSLHTDNEFAKYIGLDFGCRRTDGFGGVGAGLLCHRGGSLCFVVDTTGSMSDEIAAVKDITIAITTARSTFGRNKPVDYVLAPFNDPAVGPVTKTDYPDVMIAALTALTATGGGDAPEMAYSGLILAFQNVRPGSTCYMFTDAGAKDGNKAGAAIALAREKRIKVVVVMSNGSKKRRAVTPRRQKRASMAEFSEITQITGGTLFTIPKSDIDEAVKMVDLGLERGQVTIVKMDQIALTSGSPVNHSISVDESISNITIAISTTGVITAVDIEDPSGAVLIPGASGSGASVIEAVSSSSIKAYTIASPAPGMWTVHITGSGLYSIQVTGKSINDFSYEFTEFLDSGHKGLKEFDGKPPAGKNVTIIVEAHGKIDPETGELDNTTVAVASALIMVKPNGDEIQRLVLDEMRPFIDYDTTAIMPSEDFRVVIEGVDSKGNKVQRWNAPMELPTTISIEIVSAEEGVFTVMAGQSIDIDIIVSNSGTTAACTLTITDSMNYFQSVTPSSSTLDTDESSHHVATFLAPDDVSLSHVTTVSVTASCGGQDQFSVFHISIVSKLVDETAPICTIVHSAGDCCSVCEMSCSDVSWSMNFTAQDAGLGLNLIRSDGSNMEADLTVDDFVSGSTDLISGSYSSDCCTRDVDIVVSDLGGNYADCKMYMECKKPQHDCKPA